MQQGRSGRQSLHMAAPLRPVIRVVWRSIMRVLNESALWTSFRGSTDSQAIGYSLRDVLLKRRIALRSVSWRLLP